MTLHERLESLEKDFSPEFQLYGEVLDGPGYHTRVPNGTWVHKTNPNMGRAHLLLSSGEAFWIERAQTILRRLLTLQDQNPLSPTYGIWPWLAEESLEEMDMPDWNWADFLGQKLSEILHDYSGLLPSDLLELCRESLWHAALSIFRRNVQPGYTNIAIKGGCVTVAAGEILGCEWLLDYGRRRLQSVVEHFEYHGGFNEYNSPAYTSLVLGICESGLRILRDENTRAHLERIRYNAWATVANHFHPATRQLVGPHSRTYSNFLKPDFLRFLGTRTGIWNEEGELEASVPRCPADLVERMRALPIEPYEARHRYIRREGARSTTGHTWFTEDACLGCVSHDLLWVQRRPLMGYWLGSDGKPVALRLRIVHDDKDFASGFVWNTQSGSRILTVSNFITTGGDHHVHLDRPADAVFPIQNLRVCYELLGSEVEGHDLGDGQFALRSGDWQAIVHTIPGHFNGHTVKWQLCQFEGRVAVEALCPLPEGKLEMKTLRDVAIVSGVEVLKREQSSYVASPYFKTAENGSLTASWDVGETTLEIVAPTEAVSEAQTHHFGAVHEAV